jgi:adenylate kinase family enzyme
MSENNKMIYGSDVHFSDLSRAARAEKMCDKNICQRSIAREKDIKGRHKSIMEMDGKTMMNYSEKGRFKSARGSKFFAELFFHNLFGAQTKMRLKR